MKPVVLERLAKAELRQARKWYDSKQAGLGNDLLAEIIAALERIERDNELGLRYENTRFPFYVLRRFPYVVYYECRPDRVRVVAIAHQRQRQGYWLRRKAD